MASFRIGEAIVIFYIRLKSKTSNLFENNVTSITEKYHYF